MGKQGGDKYAETAVKPSQKGAAELQADPGHEVGTHQQL